MKTGIFLAVFCALLSATGANAGPAAAHSEIAAKNLQQAHVLHQALLVKFASLRH